MPNLDIVRPKFVVMDSADLGNIIRDKHSADLEKRRSAEDFERSFNARGCVLGRVDSFQPEHCRGDT